MNDNLLRSDAVAQQIVTLARGALVWQFHPGLAAKGIGDEINELGAADSSGRFAHPIYWPPHDEGRVSVFPNSFTASIRRSLGTTPATAPSSAQASAPTYFARFYFLLSMKAKP